MGKVGVVIVGSGRVRLAGFRVGVEKGRGKRDGVVASEWHLFFGGGYTEVCWLVVDLVDDDDG